MLEIPGPEPDPEIFSRRRRRYHRKYYRIGEIRPPEYWRPPPIDWPVLIPIIRPEPVTPEPSTTECRNVALLYATGLVEGKQWWEYLKVPYFWDPWEGWHYIYIPWCDHTDFNITYDYILINTCDPIYHKLYADIYQHNEGYRLLKKWEEKRVTVCVAVYFTWGDEDPEQEEKEQPAPDVPDVSLPRREPSEVDPLTLPEPEIHLTSDPTIGIPIIPVPVEAIEQHSTPSGGGKGSTPPAVIKELDVSFKIILVIDTKLSPGTIISSERYAIDADSARKLLKNWLPKDKIDEYLRDVTWVYRQDYSTKAFQMYGNTYSSIWDKQVIYQ